MSLKTNERYIKINEEIKELDDIQAKMQNYDNSSYIAHLKLPGNFNEAAIVISRENNKINREIHLCLLKFLATKEERERKNIKEYLLKLISLIELELDKSKSFEIEEEYLDFYNNVKELINKKVANNLLLEEIQVYAYKYEALLQEKRKIEELEEPNLMFKIRKLFKKQ